MYMNDLKRTNYLVNETLIEKNAEQSIDMEMNLPDYCADISNILQCFAFVNITSGTVTEEKIQIDGTILVRALYLSEGEIYSYEQSESFSKSMECHVSSVGAVLDLSTTQQYLNSRAASPRKIEIHGAFVIHAKVSSCKSAGVIESVEPEHIQIHKDMLSACTASGNACASIDINQVIDIGTDKPPIKSIIRNTTVAQVVETKQVSGKVLVKGELKVKTLYKSESNTVESIENTLPLSQILDIEGMNENSTVDIKLRLSALEVLVKPSALGNMSLLDISATARLCACAYNCIDFPVLKDAYSTDFACECTYKEVCVDKIITTLSKNYMHQFDIDKIADLSSVKDIWCDELTASAKLKDENLVVSGTLKTYVLYEDLEGKLGLKSVQNEYTFTENIGNVSNIKCEPNVIISGTDYLILENGVQIRADMHLDAVVFECVSEKVVDDIAFSDTPLQKQHSLFIYYAHPGDTLWNIAGKYHTTVKHIMEQNALESEEITAEKPLLIWG